MKLENLQSNNQCVAGEINNDLVREFNSAPLPIPSHLSGNLKNIKNVHVKPSSDENPTNPELGNIKEVTANNKQNNLSQKRKSPIAENTQISTVSPMKKISLVLHDSDSKKSNSKEIVSSIQSTSATSLSFNALSENQKNIVESTLRELSGNKQLSNESEGILPEIIQTMPEFSEYLLVIENPDNVAAKEIRLSSKHNYTKVLHIKKDKTGYTLLTTDNKLIKLGNSIDDIYKAILLSVNESSRTKISSIPKGSEIDTHIKALKEKVIQHIYNSPNRVLYGLLAKSPYDTVTKKNIPDLSFQCDEPSLLRVRHDALARDRKEYFTFKENQDFASKLISKNEIQSNNRSNNAEDEEYTKCYKQLNKTMKAAYTNSPTFRRLFNYAFDTGLAKWSLVVDEKFSTTQAAKNSGRCVISMNMRSGIDNKDEIYITTDGSKLFNSRRSIINQLVSALTGLTHDELGHPRGPIIEYSNIILKEMGDTTSPQIAGKAKTVKDIVTKDSQSDIKQKSSMDVATEVSFGIPIKKRSSQVVHDSSQESIRKKNKPSVKKSTETQFPLSVKLGTNLDTGLTLEEFNEIENYNAARLQSLSEIHPVLASNVETELLDKGFLLTRVKNSPTDTLFVTLHSSFSQAVNDNSRLKIDENEITTKIPEGMELNFLSPHGYNLMIAIPEKQDEYVSAEEDIMSMEGKTISIYSRLASTNSMRDNVQYSEFTEDTAGTSEEGKIRNYTCKPDILSGRTVASISVIRNRVRGENLMDILTLESHPDSSGKERNINTFKDLLSVIECSHPEYKKIVFATCRGSSGKSDKYYTYPTEHATDIQIPVLAKNVAELSNTALVNQSNPTKPTLDSINDPAIAANYVAEEVRKPGQWTTLCERVVPYALMRMPAFKDTQLNLYRPSGTPGKYKAYSRISVNKAGESKYYINLAKTDDGRYSVINPKYKPIEILNKNDSFYASIIDAMSKEQWESIIMGNGSQAEILDLRHRVADTILRDKDLINLISNADYEFIINRKVPVKAESRAKAEAILPTKMPTDPSQNIPFAKRFSTEIRKMGEFRNQHAEILPQIIYHLPELANIKFEITVESDIPGQSYKIGASNEDSSRNVAAKLILSGQHYWAVSADGRKIAVPADGDCFYHAVLASLPPAVRQTIVGQASGTESVRILRNKIADHVLKHPEIVDGFVVSTSAYEHNRELYEEKEVKMRSLDVQKHAQNRTDSITSLISVESNTNVQRVERSERNSKSSVMKGSFRSDEEHNNILPVSHQHVNTTSINPAIISSLDNDNSTLISSPINQVDKNEFENKTCLEELDDRLNSACANLEGLDLQNLTHSDIESIFENKSLTESIISEKNIIAEHDFSAKKSFKKEYVSAQQWGDNVLNDWRLGVNYIEKAVKTKDESAFNDACQVFVPDNFDFHSFSKLPKGTKAFYFSTLEYLVSNNLVSRPFIQKVLQLLIGAGLDKDNNSNILAKIVFPASGNPHFADSIWYPTLWRILVTCGKKLDPASGVSKIIEILLTHKYKSSFVGMPVIFLNYNRSMNFYRATLGDRKYLRDYYAVPCSLLPSYRQMIDSNKSSGFIKMINSYRPHAHELNSNLAATLPELDRMKDLVGVDGPVLEKYRDRATLYPTAEAILLPIKIVDQLIRNLIEKESASSIFDKDKRPGSQRLSQQFMRAFECDKQAGSDLFALFLKSLSTSVSQNTSNSKFIRNMVSLIQRNDDSFKSTIHEIISINNDVFYIYLSLLNSIYEKTGDKNIKKMIKKCIKDFHVEEKNLSVDERKVFMERLTRHKEDTFPGQNAQLAQLDAIAEKANEDLTKRLDNQIKKNETSKEVNDNAHKLNGIIGAFGMIVPETAYELLSCDSNAKENELTVALDLYRIMSETLEQVNEQYEVFEKNRFNNCKRLNLLNDIKESNYQLENLKTKNHGSTSYQIGLNYETQRKNIESKIIRLQSELHSLNKNVVNYESQEFNDLANCIYTFSEDNYLLLSGIKKTLLELESSHRSKRNELAELQKKANVTDSVKSSEDLDKLTSQLAEIRQQISTEKQKEQYYLKHPYVAYDSKLQKVVDRLHKLNADSTKLKLQRDEAQAKIKSDISTYEKENLYILTNTLQDKYIATLAEIKELKKKENIIRHQHILKIKESFFTSFQKETMAEGKKKYATDSHIKWLRENADQYKKEIERLTGKRNETYSKSVPKMPPAQALLIDSELEELDLKISQARLSLSFKNREFEQYKKKNYPNERFSLYDDFTKPISSPLKTKRDKLKERVKVLEDELNRNIVDKLTASAKINEIQKILKGKINENNLSIIQSRHLELDSVLSNAEFYIKATERKLEGVKKRLTEIDKEVDKESGQNILFFSKEITHSLANKLSYEYISYNVPVINSVRLNDEVKAHMAQPVLREKCNDAIKKSYSYGELDKSKLRSNLETVIRSHIMSCKYYIDVINNISNCLKAHSADNRDHSDLSKNARNIWLNNYISGVVSSYVNAVYTSSVSQNEKIKAEIATNLVAMSEDARRQYAQYKLNKVSKSSPPISDAGLKIKMKSSLVGEVFHLSTLSDENTREVQRTLKAQESPKESDHKISASGKNSSDSAADTIKISSLPDSIDVESKGNLEALPDPGVLLSTGSNENRTSESENAATNSTSVTVQHADLPAVSELDKLPTSKPEDINNVDQNKLFDSSSESELAPLSELVRSNDQDINSAIDTHQQVQGLLPELNEDIFTHALDIFESEGLHMFLSSIENAEQEVFDQLLGTEDVREKLLGIPEELNDHEKTQVPLLAGKLETSNTQSSSIQPAAPNVADVADKLPKVTLGTEDVREKLLGIPEELNDHEKIQVPLLAGKLETSNTQSPSIQPAAPNVADVADKLPKVTDTLKNTGAVGGNESKVEGPETKDQISLLDKAAQFKKTSWSEKIDSYLEQLEETSDIPKFSDYQEKNVPQLMNELEVYDGKPESLKQKKNDEKTVVRNNVNHKIPDEKYKDFDYRLLNLPGKAEEHALPHHNFSASISRINTTNPNELSLPDVPYDKPGMRALSEQSSRLSTADKINEYIKNMPDTAGENISILPEHNVSHPLEINDRNLSALMPEPPRNEPISFLEEIEKDTGTSLREDFIDRYIKNLPATNPQGVKSFTALDASQVQLELPDVPKDQVDRFDYMAKIKGKVIDNVNKELTIFMQQEVDDIRKQFNFIPLLERMENMTKKDTLTRLKLLENDIKKVEGTTSIKDEKIFNLLASLPIDKAESIQKEHSITSDIYESRYVYLDKQVRQVFIDNIKSGLFQPDLDISSTRFNMATNNMDNAKKTLEALMKKRVITYLEKSIK